MILLEVLLMVYSAGNQANWKSECVKITCSTQLCGKEQKVEKLLNCHEHGVLFTLFTPYCFSTV